MPDEAGFPFYKFYFLVINAFLLWVVLSVIGTEQNAMKTCSETRLIRIGIGWRGLFSSFRSTFASIRARWHKWVKKWKNVRHRVNRLTKRNAKRYSLQPERRHSQFFVRWQKGESSFFIAPWQFVRGTFASVSGILNGVSHCCNVFFVYLSLIFICTRIFRHIDCVTELYTNDTE